MAKDVLTNGPLFSRSEPNSNISIIVFLSGVDFGTVWRLHNWARLFKVSLAFVEKMREAFAMQKLYTFFQQKILAYLRY